MQHPQALKTQSYDLAAALSGSVSLAMSTIVCWDADTFFSNDVVFATAWPGQKHASLAMLQPKVTVAWPRRNKAAI
jgi:hypothetical protein